MSKKTVNGITNCGGNGDAFYNQLIDKLANDQKSNGEFGVLRENNKLKSQHGEYHEKLKDAKPNGFLTRYALELLFPVFQKDPSHPKLRKSLNWFNNHISPEGYFVRIDLVDTKVENSATGQPIKSEEKVNVYRHTAAALASVIFVDGVTERSVKMINNLLEHKNSDGGWSPLDGKESDIETTTYVLKALTTCEINDIADNEFEKIKKYKLVEAIDSAESWLIKQCDNFTQDVAWSSKLQVKAAQLGINLAINSSIFGNEKYQEKTTSFLSRLYHWSKNGLWQLENGDVDIETSAIMLATLFKFQKHVEIHFDLLVSRNLLIDKILTNQNGIDSLDSSILYFLVDTCSDDRDKIVLPTRQNEIVKRRYPKNKNGKIMIVIASPSDVGAIREKLLYLEVDFRRGNYERHCGFEIKVDGWEVLASQPGYPQNIINEKIIAESDFVIAIFRHKLGTPTKNIKTGKIQAESGTAEELLQALDITNVSFPIGMAYFYSEAPNIPSDNPNKKKIEKEWQRLSKFKKSIEDRMIYKEFTNDSDLLKIILEDLEKNIIDYIIK
ncbi:MAG: hypothetical protein LBU70_07170 [Chitinispirillales bacterium]|jgi:hypothetical protein|nr:hypothetical protein [Chitinispirillales bacterium]